MKAITLQKTLFNRGYCYNSNFKGRAEDIYFDSTDDLCFALGYILKNVRRIDAEIPDDRDDVLAEIIPNYPIASGITSGGNDMKWAPQYRIYFNSIYNMPSALKYRLQDDNQMRITGSLFVEACMYVGFNPGNMQDKEMIKEAILEVFCDENEQSAFWDGYGIGW